MKTIVTGPGGFVGKHIMNILPGAIPLANLRGGREELDRFLPHALEGAELIIHTAAISDIGSCERDPDASYLANVLLPIAIAKAAPQAKLVFFSSDQVYGGMVSEGPYTEEETAPSNTYARHKLEMENRVFEINPDAVMLRATWMYSPTHGYLSNMISASAPLTVGKQYRGITSVYEAAENAVKAQSLPGGAYNFGSENPLSMAELTKRTLSMLGKNIPVTEGEARHNLWINTAKARLRGIDFASSEEGLDGVIRNSEFGIRNE